MRHGTTQASTMISLKQSTVTSSPSKFTLVINVMVLSFHYIISLLFIFVFVCFIVGFAGQLYSEMGHYLSTMGNYSLAAEFTAQSAVLRQRDCMLTLYLSDHHYNLPLPLSLPPLYFIIIFLFSYFFIIFFFAAPMTASRLWYDTANYRIAAVDYKSASECLLNCIKV